MSIVRISLGAETLIMIALLVMTAFIARYGRGRYGDNARRLLAGPWRRELFWIAIAIVILTFI